MPFASEEKKSCWFRPFCDIHLHCSQVSWRVSCLLTCTINRESIYISTKKQKHTSGPWFKFKEHSDGWGSNCSYRKVLPYDRLSHTCVNSSSLNEANVAASGLVVSSYFLRVTQFLTHIIFLKKKTHFHFSVIHFHSNSGRLGWVSQAVFCLDSFIPKYMYYSSSFMFYNHK